MNASDPETRLKAEMRQLRDDVHGLSVGRAFVHGRLAGARRAKALGTIAYLACGAALAAVTALLWWRPGQADTARLLATGASVLWTIGLLLRR